MDDSHNGNNNGVKKEIQKEIEHQERLANVEHEQMKSATNELKSKHDEYAKHTSSKIDDVKKIIASSVDGVNKTISNNHKFVLTTVVTIMGFTLGLTFTGDQTLTEELNEETAYLEKRIHEVEVQLYDTRDVTMQNDRLLDAIVRGDVLLKSELEQDGRLLEIIELMNANGGDE